MVKISKEFSGVKALDEVHLKVRPGKVHVICGENGAGKSTLMKVLNGSYTADSGDIFCICTFLVIKQVNCTLW
jgi:ABC-type sugar transport system ATPase subunit